MHEQVVFDLLKSAGAIIDSGHFVYTSGRHGGTYINKDALYRYPDKVSVLCQQIVCEFGEYDVDVVVSPALGGIALSQWTTYHFNTCCGILDSSSRPVEAVFAEKDEDGYFQLRRGYDQVVHGKNVLVVEDIVTTGTSARQTVELVEMHGGTVVGLAALCNRGNVLPKDIGVPYFRALLNIRFDTWAPEACPLCVEGRLVNVRLGHGRKFIEDKYA